MLRGERLGRVYDLVQVALHEVQHHVPVDMGNGTEMSFRKVVTQQSGSEVILMY